MSALSSSSRYVDGDVAELQHTDKSIRYVWEVPEPISKSDLEDTWVVIMTSYGDSLDALAHQYLGDTRLWWVIADVNRDVVEDELRIQPGTRLIVPTEEFVARLGL